MHPPQIFGKPTEPHMSHPHGEGGGLLDTHPSTHPTTHGGRRRPMCDPQGCATVLGAVGGGGGLLDTDPSTHPTTTGKMP